MHKFCGMACCPILIFLFHVVINFSSLPAKHLGFRAQGPNVGYTTPWGALGRSTEAVVASSKIGRGALNKNKGAVEETPGC